MKTRIAASLGGLAIALAGCGGAANTRVYTVPSPSMAPTYSVGSRLVLNLDAYGRSSPQRGDVIVFHPPTGADNPDLACGAPHPADEACPAPTPHPSASSFIKRVVAVGGDQVAIVNNRVVLNGQPLKEPFINKHSSCASDANICNLRTPITIPKGDVFVLGDNRVQSSDSRVWGPVPSGWIIGKVTGAA